MIHTHMHTQKAMGMELDWIEEYQWVDPPRLWEANSGKGWIQKWSHFQPDSLFSPRPYTKVMGKKQDGSLLFLYPTFWWAQMVLVLYSGPALWLWVIPIHYSYQWYWNEPKLLSSCLPLLKCETTAYCFAAWFLLVLTRWHGTLTYCPIPRKTFHTRPMYIT